MTSGKKVSRNAPPATENDNQSVRTLLLGIDRAGTIVHHDRTAPDILVHAKGNSLIGMHLSDITPGGAGDQRPRGAHARSRGGEPVTELLEAVKHGREANVVLTITTANGPATGSVVTLRPMRGAAGSPLAAMASLQIPVLDSKPYAEPKLIRERLLHDSFREIESTQDFAELAEGLLNRLVPHFCTAADLLVVESLVGDDEYPVHAPDGSHPLRRLALKHYEDDPAWSAAFPSGETLRYPAGSMYLKCLETGTPILQRVITEEAAKQLSRQWRRKPVARLLSGVSMLLLPLVARNGTTLGFFVCTRATGFRRFDAYEQELGMEFAGRAAGFIDSARKYNREHATALTLQRSMLPRGLTAPSSVEVKHRYMPGSALVEVGGDWYESISLPGGRVALVIGDVAGHGVRAAVTMGRLRTAIQTLAMLELPPAESLQNLDDLMARMLGGADPHFATCSYATYDAVTGELELASAGHLPPLLVAPDGTNQLLDVTSPSPPLGVGNVSMTPGEGYETRRVQVEDGSLLVLYTDGLVESRDADIQEGLDWLTSTFSGPEIPGRPLEQLCKKSLDKVYDHAERDDIAVLIARLRRIPADNRMTWSLAPEEISVRQARMLVRDPMKRWGLEDMIPVAELLVSELVTNAVRYGSNEFAIDEQDIEFRLILEGGLICEVYDASPALPRVLRVDRDAENGRGLHVVSQLSRRWGSRRTPGGKVVWCELEVPDAILEAAGAVPVEALTMDPLEALEPLEGDMDATGPMPVLDADGLVSTGPMAVVRD